MLIDNSEKDQFESLENNLRVCIDWLSFTFNPSENFFADDVIMLLGFQLTDFVRAPKGANGYRSMLKLNEANIRILHDGKEDMGVHVDVSGSAIATLLSAWQKKNTVSTPFNTQAISYKDWNYTLLLDLLDTLSQVVTFTRIDLAIDDMGGNYYSCEDILLLIENQQFVSKFRKYSTYSSSSLNDGTRQGNTIYFGSRQSEIFLRVYDKQLELSNKHHADCPFHWIRWELELKKKRANQMVKLLLETHSLSTVCIGILGHYLRFIEHDNPIKSRCSNTAIWDAFINNMDKLSLYVPDAQKTIEDTKKWVDKYIGASLSAIIEADGGSLDFIYNHLPSWQCKRERNRKLTNRLIQETKKWEF